MKTFDEIYHLAVTRKGEEELEARLPVVLDAAALAATDDDRWLAAMARCVFAAGFRWKVIQAKWDGFEDAFMSFSPAAVAGFGAATTTALSEDRRIVRNPQKIHATVANAAFVRDVAAEHGSFGRYMADWPDDDVVGLWAWLKKAGARLGGATGPRMLRQMGKDTFILTPDICHALTQQGVLTGSPTSNRQQRAAQEAFTAWHQESGRPMAHLSVILACSVDR